VVLIDRDSFPRDKLCGEFLSWDALPILERLGVSLSGTPAIDRCRIAGRRRSYQFEFPSPARGVSRRLLDDLLFRQAAATGAQTRPSCMVTAVSHDRVTTDAGDIGARVVVGAWGRWGRFDTQLKRAFVRDRAHRNFGFKRHYQFSSCDDRNAVVLHPFRRGYLGVAAIEGLRTNICGLVHASRLAGHKGRWEAFVDEIRREEPHLDALFAAHNPAQDDFLSSEPVIFRARSAVEDGIFMIGDASGIIDPLTGNGMAMAIQSALLAAPFILEALAGRRDEAGRGYRRRHNEFFAPRIAWSRRVAFLLARPALLDAAMAAAPRSSGPFLLRKTRAAGDQVARILDQWLA